MKEQLIFVYNANGDLLSSVTDFAHKLLSPSTYQCHLCALTYGNFLIKQEWKSFIENLPVQTLFLYKDEFEKQYRIETDLPTAFISANGAIREIITRQEIESCQSLDELRNIVTEKLKKNVQHYHPNLQ